MKYIVVCIAAQIAKGTNEECFFFPGSWSLFVFNDCS